MHIFICGCGLEINQNRFLVYIKPNKKESKFEGYDELKKAYVISINAPAHDNKANNALLLFLKKQGIPAKIKSGFTSKLKVLEKR